jgi:predicted RNA-binding Zn ribbon-like protein
MTLPPHNLQLVIDFVNTRDLETGEDRTDTPAHLADWFDQQGLRTPDGPAVGAPEFEQAITLRESLRRVLVGHSHHEESPGAAQYLEEVAERGLLSVRFCPECTTEIVPRAQGYPGILAQLLVPVAHASMDGTWARMKACVADDCQWAFYDQSRNHSGRWCDMAVCGNRTKVRAYRAKRER